MIRIVFAIAAGLTWASMALFSLIYAERIKAHRTDITKYDSPYSGRFNSLERNLLSSVNYDAEGQRKVRLLRYLTWGQLIPAATLVVLYVTWN